MILGEPIFSRGLCPWIEKHRAPPRLKSFRVAFRPMPRFASQWRKRTCEAVHNVAAKHALDVVGAKSAWLGRPGHRAIPQRIRGSVQPLPIGGSPRLPLPCDFQSRATPVLPQANWNGTRNCGLTKDNINQWVIGAADRNRTYDPIITNDVLYQLSYRGKPGLNSDLRRKPQERDDRPQSRIRGERLRPAGPSTRTPQHHRKS